MGVRLPRSCKIPGPLAYTVLLLATLALSGCSGSPELDAPAADNEVAPTVLVIGMDGADWQIIDPLIRQGRMPNLQRLVARGVRAKLLSVSPLLSPVVWTTIATGVEPTRHGILDFLVQDASGASVPVTSLQRQVPTFWEMLSRSGVDVGVVGWWASWPADPVRGYLVSDRVAYQLFGFKADPKDPTGKTWPPQLHDRILEQIVEPTSVGWDRIRPYLDGERSEPDQFSEAERERIDGLRVAIAAGETHLRIARTLGATYGPRLEIVYFEGTDTVAHLFMPFRPPALPGLDAASSASFSQVIDRYYETVDRHIGTLVDRRPNANILIVSDHGFASDSTRPRTTDSRIGHGPAADWHRRFGILVFSGPAVRPGIEIEEATVYDIAPTILALFGEPIPRSWPGRVLESALLPEFLQRHPPSYRNDDPLRVHLAGGVRNPDPAAADLLEKLRGLGYIGGTTPDSEEVSSGYQGLAVRNNTGLSYLAQGRHVEAEQEFRAALEARPEAGVLLVNLAVALKYQKRTAEAATLLARAMKTPLARRVAGVQLAHLSLESGDLEAAEGLAQAVLDVEPSAADAHNVMGLILGERGDVEGAARHFLEAANLDPHAATARNNLGNLEKRRGETERARAWYLRAIESDPFLMGAYSNLGLVYQERGEVRRAVDLYQRALGKSPEHPIVLNNLGSLYFDLEDLDRARSLWERSARADEFYPSPLNNLAGLAIIGGRWREAEALLRSALELEPEYGDARINMALVLRHRGETDSAREQLRIAAGDPRSGIRPWTELGRLELDTGQPGPASSAWQRALEMDPQSVEALKGLRIAKERLRGGGAPR